MGWLIVLFFVPLAENLSTGGILFLILGGIFIQLVGLFTVLSQNGWSLNIWDTMKFFMFSYY